MSGMSTGHPLFTVGLVSDAEQRIPVVGRDDHDVRALKIAGL